MSLFRTSLVDSTTAGLKALRPELKEVPGDKLINMVWRTIIGSIFVFVGLGLLGIQVYVIYKSQSVKDISLWLVGGGASFLVIGASTWSSQLVAIPFKMFTNLLSSVFAIVRGSK